MQKIRPHDGMYVNNNNNTNSIINAEHEDDDDDDIRTRRLSPKSEPLPAIVLNQRQRNNNRRSQMRRTASPSSVAGLSNAAASSSALGMPMMALSDLHMHHSNTSRLQFNELLISAVENRPAIWNSSNPDHKNTRRLATLWDEIGSELKTAVKIVVERWRNLRDTYRKQLRKINHACQNGEGEIPRVRWMHFEQMSFLIPSLTTIIRSSGGSQPNGLGHHMNTIEEPSNMMMELPEHLRELEASDGDVHSVDNIFEMVEPILNNHSPTGSSVERSAVPNERRSRSNSSTGSSAASDDTSRAMLNSSPPLLQPHHHHLHRHHRHQDQHQQQQSSHSTRPSRKRRRSVSTAGATTCNNASSACNNHVDGQFLQHLYQSTGLIQEHTRNLQMVNNQLDTCLNDKPDPIEAFLYSLAPSLRATSPRLLPSLQMNLIYITSRYSEGTVPKQLLQFDDK